MKILHVDSGIQGDGSASRRLSAAILARLLARTPDAQVTTRDLAAQPLSHLTLADLKGPDENAALAEFLDADTIVIGASMYNFAIPSQLKAWIDRLLIPGVAFRYGEDGPEGLIHGKRVLAGVARGGAYPDGTPGEAIAHDASYLDAVFRFIGIDDVRIAIAEGLMQDPDARDATIAAAAEGLDIA